MVVKGRDRHGGGDVGRGGKDAGTVAIALQHTAHLEVAGGDDDFIQRRPVVKPIIAGGGRLGGLHHLVGAAIHQLQEYGGDSHSGARAFRRPIVVGVKPDSGCLRRRAAVAALRWRSRYRGG